LHFAEAVVSAVTASLRNIRVLHLLAVLGAVVQIGSVGAAQWWLHDALSGLPPKEDLSKLGDMAEATVIVDASGRPAFSIFEEQRREVPLSAISPHLVSAVVAIEDQRFYDHSGVDVVRIAGAALANLREGRRAQGGSTLTQQLARQSFLTLNKTFTRKMQEVLLAMRIEGEYSKPEILQLYLNKVYFGSGLYGAEAASLGYFGKSASALTVDEAALLAGLVKSPSSLAPTVNMERAIARRNVVLQAMHDTGAIDADALDRARQAPVHLVDALRKDAAFGLHFRELVRIQLVERFGRERVYEGGLKVYTTIDLAMQRAADAAVLASLDELDRRRAAALKARRRPVAEPDAPLEAALVAIDPKSGEVRAMVGGRRFADSTFNRAVQARRQPGSAFKPFVYAAALESGYSPATLIEHLDEPVDVPEGEWTPEDGHADATEMTMRTALRTSSNRAAVKMIQRVGIPVAVDYARRLGVGEMPAVPSLALGSGEVTLLDLTSAFGAFAAAGIRHAPLLIRRVEDAEGQVLFQAAPESAAAVTPQTAFLMSTMLADVVNSGTAWKARQLGFTLPAAGKTGTTNDYRDAWFVGFTPSLVAGVWVGYDQPRPILPGSAYAGDVAVPLWARFMKTATAKDKPVWFRPPENIVTAQVCRLSGKRPVGGCAVAHVALEDGSVSQRSTIVTEYFVRGTEQTATCHLHVGRSFFARIGDFFSAAPSATASRPARTSEEQRPAAVVASASQELPKVSEEPEPKKKRGFWSRLFGRGDKNESKDAQKKRP
jgi:penicillin-binding protein 1A